MTIAAMLTVVGLALFLVWGLKTGIDFTGGSLMEITFLQDRPSNDEINEALKDFDLGEATLQPYGEKGIIIRSKFLDEETHQKVLEALQDKFGETDPSASSGSIEEAEGTEAQEKPQVNIEGLPEGVTVSEVQMSEGAETQKSVIQEERFESIGPSIGQELKVKSIYAVIIAIIGIALYIAWAFRKVSKPVTSWKYGVISIIALAHDVLVVIGAFVLLGKFLNVEVGVSFIAALLTVLGYSINDTIVIFDRIRENLPRSEDDFETTVNNSINQTMARSINTTLTTLSSLVAVFFFGGETVKFFALALIIGITSGAYSSIFIASPLLVVWQKLAERRLDPSVRERRG